MRGRWWGLVAMAVLGLGCRPSGDDGGAGAVHAVATVGMVADIVRNVGGEHVVVDSIMGPGVDPHLYKATRDDVQSLLRADVIFYSGLMLEGKMIDVLDKLGQSKPVYATAEAIDPALLLWPAAPGTPSGAQRDEESRGHADPHVWMDVRAWRACVDVVAEGLAEVDPEHRAQYQQRAARYAEMLERLDDYARETLATIPEANRVLITSHDAFNYFGRAYGMEVVGVQGLSTDSEAGLQQINSLVDLLVERRVSAVFVESSVPRKNIEALIDGAAARGHQVVVGGELFSDAMGPAGTAEGTYVGMILHNVNSITEALGGAVPADRGESIGNAVTPEPAPGLAPEVASATDAHSALAERQ